MPCAAVSAAARRRPLTKKSNVVIRQDAQQSYERAGTCNKDKQSSPANL